MIAKSNFTSRIRQRYYHLTCQQSAVDYKTDQIHEKGKRNDSANKKLVKQLKVMKDQIVDELLHQAHYEAFEEINCLTCANCCKTTSPVFTEKDIERIAGLLKMRPGNFSSTYLFRDDEGDMVLKSSPCAFLQPDNTCSIYSQRPAACRNYPHTDRKKVRQLLDLTLRNTMICPAVQEIFDSIRKRLNIG